MSDLPKTEQPPRDIPLPGHAASNSPTVLLLRAFVGEAFGRAAVRCVRWFNAFFIVVAASVVAVMGYRRRWLSDDGLICTRAVRQIVAGNGPVFNVDERAETSTSALWQWLLAGLMWISHADAGKLAVYTGLVLCVAGFVLAMLGCAQLYDRERMLLPAGVLVLLALPPVWDFATSGLETGLATFWSGLSWLLLVRQRLVYRRGASTAFVLGLGVVVRPDLAIASSLFLLALWLRHRPAWRTTVGWCVVAFALPLGYEVFRAGFYGELVPLPAIAKGASRAVWGRGWTYLGDFVTPYRLWIPLLLLAVIATITWRGGTRQPGMVIAAGPAGGVLMIGYTVRVGGDFMHARMILPGLFLALLPILFVPVSRTTTALLATVAVWAGLCATSWRVPYQYIGSQGIADERSFWVATTGSPNPISVTDYTRPLAALSSFDRGVLASQHYWLILPPTSDAPVGELIPLREDIGVQLAHSDYHLGSIGEIVPLNQMVVDPLSLAYPLAAHIHAQPPGRAGHDNPIPLIWLIADLADPHTIPPGIDPSALAAARHALTCGPLADLQASARAPLTLGRFLHNLTGTLGRTRLVIPTNPHVAEEEFCAAGTATKPGAWQTPTDDRASFARAPR